MMNIQAAFYANEEQSAVIVSTVDRGDVLVSQVDRPAIWAEVMNSNVEISAFDSVSHEKALVRLKRTALLMESDWTQMADSPLSSEQKEAWCVYRQKLRDLPSLVDGATEIIWPELPE